MPEPVRPHRFWVSPLWTLTAALCLVVIVCVGGWFRANALRNRSIDRLFAKGFRVQETWGLLPEPAMVWCQRRSRWLERAVTIHQGVQLNLTFDENADDTFLEGCRDDLRVVQGLAMGGTAITSKTFTRVSRLDELEYLELWETKFDDDGLNHVARIAPRLKHLDLRRTRISNAGCEAIGRISALRFVMLSENDALTDEGIRRLRHCPALEKVHLCSPFATDLKVHVSDQTIVDLFQAPKLRLVSLPRKPEELLKLESLIKSRYPGRDVKICDFADDEEDYHYDWRD